MKTVVALPSGAEAGDGRLSDRNRRPCIRRDSSSSPQSSAAVAIAGSDSLSCRPSSASAQPASAIVLPYRCINFFRLDTACACTARLVHGGESRNQDWNYSDQQRRRSASKAQPARHTTTSSTLKETLMHARVPIAPEKTRPSPTPPSHQGRSPQRSLFGRKSESSCSPTVPHVPRANHAAVTTSPESVQAVPSLWI